MYREHCNFASDYSTEIKSLADSKVMASIDRIVQFPFVTLVCLFLFLLLLLLSDVDFWVYIDCR